MIFLLVEILSYAYVYLHARSKLLESHKSLKGVRLSWLICQSMGLLIHFGLVIRIDYDKKPNNNCLYKADRSLYLEKHTRMGVCAAGDHSFISLLWFHEWSLFHKRLHILRSLPSDLELQYSRYHPDSVTLLRRCNYV